MKIYNKLVRDNIPEIMISNGAKPVTRILNDEEYLNELNKKLEEEVAEYLQDNRVEEIADIVEVLYAILKSKNINLKDFDDIRTAKKIKKGSFDKKIFLEKEE